MALHKTVVAVSAAVLLTAAAISLTPEPPRSVSVLASDATTQSSDSLHPMTVFRVGPEVRNIPDAFKQAGVEYHPEDQITVSPADLSYGLGGIVTDRQALPVKVIDGKHTTTQRTWQGTVGDLLTEKKIELGNEDRVSPALSTPLTASTVISITRVDRATQVLYETIPFQTVQQDDPSTYRGETKVTQVGANGKKEIDHLLIREDGELKSDTITATKIVQAVMNKIVSVGTKLKLGPAKSGRATYYVNGLGTKVATDQYKRGTKLLITNLSNGKKIEVVNDGCICDNSSVLVDLNPSYFLQLGGTLGQGVLGSVKVEEIFN